MRKGPKPVWIYLVSSARKIWRWSSERKEVKRTSSKCANCKETFKDDKEKEIDHITAIGKAPRSVCGDPKSFKGWDIYYSRLYCGKENLQALCHNCHKKKTLKERKR